MGWQGGKSTARRTISCIFAVLKINPERIGIVRPLDGFSSVRWAAWSLANLK
jgi:hypothetical protein